MHVVLAKDFILEPLLESFAGSSALGFHEQGGLDDGQRLTSQGAAGVGGVPTEGGGDVCSGHDWWRMTVVLGTLRRSWRLAKRCLWALAVWIWALVRSPLSISYLRRRQENETASLRSSCCSGVSSRVMGVGDQKCLV